MQCNLSLLKLLIQICDGPTVNKTVFSIINEDIFKMCENCMINIGTCPLQSIHNAFQKGLCESSENIRK